MKYFYVDQDGKRYDRDDAIGQLGDMYEQDVDAYNEYVQDGGLLDIEDWATKEAKDYLKVCEEDAWENGKVDIVV